jgi:hypothetical protein
MLHVSRDLSRTTIPVVMSAADSYVACVYCLGMLILATVC